MWIKLHIGFVKKIFFHYNGRITMIDFIHAFWFYTFCQLDLYIMDLYILELYFLSCTGWEYKDIRKVPRN